MSKVNNKSKKHHNYLTPYQPSPFKKTANTIKKNNETTNNTLDEPSEPIFKKPKFVHVLPSENELSNDNDNDTTDNVTNDVTEKTSVDTNTVTTDVTNVTDVTNGTDVTDVKTESVPETTVDTTVTDVTDVKTEQDLTLEKVTKELVSESSNDNSDSTDKTEIINKEPSTMVIENNENIEDNDSKSKTEPESTLSLVAPTESGESLLQIILTKLSNLLSFLNRN